MKEFHQLYYTRGPTLSSALLLHERSFTITIPTRHLDPTCRHYIESHTDRRNTSPYFGNCILTSFHLLSSPHFSLQFSVTVSWLYFESSLLCRHGLVHLPDPRPGEQPVDPALRHPPDDSLLPPQPGDQGAPRGWEHHLG